MTKGPTGLRDPTDELGAECKALKRDLKERTKELRCLYDVTDITERSGITLDELYQEVANLLPQGWQYPEITYARITIAGKEFKTKNFRETEWKQSSEIKIGGEKAGIVEVDYLEAKPEIDEGPFLKEERLLLDEIARQLGQITERRQAGDNPGKTSDEDRSKEQARLASLQKRFVRLGFEAVEEEDEIRLVFSLCRYRPECDEEIERCIKNFKDLRELLSASEGKLQRMGICPRGVFIVRLLRELPEEVLRQKILERSVYKSPQEIFDYLRYSMRDLEKEVFKVIYLDKRDKIIDTVDLFEGTLDSIPIRPREIMEGAIAHNATGLIFAHNHPTGDPAPSRTDKQLTRELVFVGMIMQIKVLDHIIIGEDKYFSFADEKLIEKYEDDFLNLRIRAAFDTGVHPTLSLK
jgi:DNA repair protein RadC